MTENVFDPSFDVEQGQQGYSWRRARIGRQAGAERLGASLFELPSGEAAFPYHLHLANEELLIVIAGTPDLRTPAGWRRLAAGEVVAFPLGERGAHQLLNRSEEPARFLIVSEMVGPEVLFYPDSGKVGAREHPPGSAKEGVFGIFHSEHSVDYFDREPEPGSAPEGGD